VTGFQVVELRDALGMSRPVFARALNITPTTLRNWEMAEPHGLGHEVLQGLYNAVFDPSDAGADRSARIDRIAMKLQLGFGSMLCFGLLSLVKEGAR
jgi:transcriptional regulator with XRE-family HTH domain